MKTIVLGDIHGRRVWKDVVNTQTFDKVVFVGDYVDSFDISGKEQLENLMDIVAFKKSCPEKVILLIGNHDYHYFPEVGDTGTSGYQANMAHSFGYVFDQDRNLFQMAYKEGTFLFTHAGFAPTWLERHWKEEWQVEKIEERIDILWRYKPFSFAFAGFNGRSNPYGDDVWQSPIWIRPRSLMKDAVLLKKELIQVVGHTQQNCIDSKGKSTGGRYYFIDTLGTSKEYLVIEEGKARSEWLPI